MMDIIREIQIARMEVDKIFEQLDKKIQQYDEGNKLENSISNNRNDSYESYYYLTSNTAIFKGKKPTGLFLNGKDRIEIGTWKKIFEVILEDCISHTAKHVDLLNLRGKISGRDRLLLSDRPDGMRTPLKITEKLFVESHYDTESLLRILTTRLLDPVGYDYSNIRIAIRND